MTVGEVLDKMNSFDISEWMAYDLSNDDKFRKNYQKELEAERIREMNTQQRAENARQFFRSFISGSKCKFSDRNSS
jgi:uncharacterized protein YeaO (DUF488 family)